MDSDESHFNVSVGSDGQSHKTVSTNHNLFEEIERRAAEAVSNRGPSAFQPQRLIARPNRLKVPGSQAGRPSHLNCHMQRLAGALHPDYGGKPRLSRTAATGSVFVEAMYNIQLPVETLSACSLMRSLHSL